MKLFPKIILFSIIPLLLGTIAVIVKDSYFTRGILETYLRETVRHQFDMQSERVRDFFGDSIKDLRVLSDQEELQSGDIPRILDYFRSQYPRLSHRFTNLYWDELSGEVHGMKGELLNVRSRYYWPRFLDGHTIITKALTHPQVQEDFFIVLVPVFRDGKQIGGVAGMVSIDELQKQLVLNPTAVEGYSALMDEDRQVIFNSSIKPELAAKMGAGQWEDENYLNFKTALPPTQWTLVMGFKRDTLYAPISRMQRESALMIILVLACTICLIYFLYRTIHRPLTNLIAAHEAVAAGNLSTQARFRGTDELAKLSQSFNQMVRSIKLTREQEQKIQDKLREAKELAEEASEAKSYFIATMSHEFRTPLQGILGATELMTLEDNPAEATHYIKIIQSSGRTLSTLVNDILEMSKLASGKAQIVADKFDLLGLLDEVTKTVRPQAEEKGLEMLLIYPSEIGSFWEGDKFKIRHILINLLANAVKFTPRGSVVLEVRELANSGDSSRLRFIVKDTGIGIDRKHFDHLFEPFYQAESEFSRTYQGSGLGLAICKRLADFLGADLHFSSEVNKGTTFYLDIKLKKIRPGIKSQALQSQCDDNQLLL